MNCCFQRLFLGAALLTTLGISPPAQAKNKVYAELIENMLSKCESAELERESSASAPCARRIAKVDRLGEKILPELLTALRERARDDSEFGVQLLLDPIVKFKTAPVIETLVGLMQEAEVQKSGSTMNSLNDALNTLSGIKPDKETERRESEDPDQKKIARKWKSWWAKNRPAFADSGPVLKSAGKLL